MPESMEQKKQRVKAVISRLKSVYPNVRCALDFSNPFELLVATVLSAQCTDKRVNLVTPALFARCPHLEDYLQLSVQDLEKMIQSTGFYKNKAKSILGAARKITEEFAGEVPRRMQDLITIPGVGRKTANVILGNAFGVPGMPVDTHMIRINHLLKLTKHTDPVKIEMDLTRLMPEEEWTDYSHRIIHHGRVCCIARRPQCGVCPIRELCPSAKGIS